MKDSVFPVNHPHNQHIHVGDRGYIQYLVAVDGSDASRRAAAYVQRILRPKDHVVYLSIVKHAEQRRAAEELLASYHQSLNEADFELVHRVLEPSTGYTSPGESICRFAQEIGADIVVTGHRGLGDKKRIFEGGVGKFVANHIHCSVMIIK
eukprot:ANDGO_06223.mRNA.1 Universal stress protein Slr1101